MRHDDNEIEDRLFDEFLSRVIKEIADDIEVPPFEEMWPEIEKKLKQNMEAKQAQKKNRTMIFRLTAAFLIFFGVGIVAYLSSPLTVNALNNKIFKTVVSIFVREPEPADVNISMSNTSEPPPGAPPPPPDWPLATGEKVVSVEEARAEAAFTFKTPDYLPKEVKLDIITLLNKYMVNQYFRSGKNRLTIEQRYTPGQFASSSTFRDAQIKKVDINGTEASLVIQHNSYTGTDTINILWFADSIQFRLETDLSEREALKVARSLK